MDKARKRMGIRVLTTFLFVVAAALAACKDEEDCAPYRPNELPAASLIIKVNETNFNPANPSNVHIGQRIEWQNWFSDPRTVTSGTGPDDPHKGELFDATLLPYCSGEAIGGRFQMVFTEPDTIHYFNSILPPGFVGPFSGTIVVLP
jgi:hypothetical protein